MERIIDKRKNNRPIVLLMAFLCVISNLSYYPLFQSLSFFRNIVIIAWLVVGSFILLKYKKIFFPVALKWYLVLFFVFLLNSAIIFFVVNTKVFESHFFSPVVTSLIIFIVATILGDKITLDDLKEILSVYVYTVTLYSIPLFVFYLMGTDLSSAYYSYIYGKNEIAVLLLCTLILLTTIYKADKPWKIIFKVIGIAFILLDMIYLRCRTSFLGVAVLAITLLLNKTTSKTTKSVLVFGIIVVIIYFLTHPDAFTSFMDDIIYAGRDSNDIDNLSSGRLKQIDEAWQVFKDNIFFGVGKRKSTDMFFVSALANYGLFAWPLLIMFVFPLLWSITQLKNCDVCFVVFFIIAVSLALIGLFEELSPFGPGVRCYILWLMWGVLLSNKERKKKDAKYRTRGVAKSFIRSA